MILSFINIRKVPREMLKTEGEALGFQHFPRDLANVNEWKIMFDPYNKILKGTVQNPVIIFQHHRILTVSRCLYNTARMRRLICVFDVRICH